MLKSDNDYSPQSFHKPWKSVFTIAWTMKNTRPENWSRPKWDVPALSFRHPPGCATTPPPGEPGKWRVCYQRMTSVLRQLSAPLVSQLRWHTFSPSLLFTLTPISSFWDINITKFTVRNKICHQGKWLKTLGVITFVLNKARVIF